MEEYMNNAIECIQLAAAEGKTTCRVEWNNCWRTAIAPRGVNIEDVVKRLKETYRKVEIQKVWYAGMGKYTTEDKPGLYPWMSTHILVDWTEEETNV
jgi:hypothetical protein